MTSTVARPALPVWQTVREAFVSVPANWQAVVRIFWAWIAIWLAILGTFLALFFRTFPRIGVPRWPESLVPPSPESFVPPSSAFFLTMVLLTVVGLLALASTAVAWHRLILLGERPPAIYLSLGGPVIRYLGRFLLIGLVAIPILLLCGLLLLPLLGTLALPDPFTPPSPGLLLALSIANLVLSLPALLVISRLFISLPGIAIGRPMTLSETWQSTEGNTVRLTLGTLLIYAPSYLVGLGAQLLITPQFLITPMSNFLLMMVLNFGVGFVIAVAAISFLSLSYRFLAGAAQLSQPEAG